MQQNLRLFAANASPTLKRPLALNAAEGTTPFAMLEIPALRTLRMFSLGKCLFFKLSINLSMP
jgi:hypothetical protein